MNKERLYDAFGELVYALVHADGKVTDTELQAFRDKLSLHAHSQNIEWSFNYEMGKEIDLEEAYQKALNTCVAIGPDPEYDALFDLLDTVARSDGLVQSEIDLTERFRTDLKEAFIRKLDG